MERVAVLSPADYSLLAIRYSHSAEVTSHDRPASARRRPPKRGGAPALEPHPSAGRRRRGGGGRVARQLAGRPAQAAGMPGIRPPQLRADQHPGPRGAVRGRAATTLASTLPPIGGEGRPRERSERGRGGGTILAPNLLKHPPPLTPPRRATRGGRGIERCAGSAMPPVAPAPGATPPSP